MVSPYKRRPCSSTLSGHPSSSLVCCLLSGETQIWLGDLRVVSFFVVLVLIVVMICRSACDQLCPCRDVFENCLFSCKDRASERHRPNQRKKKRPLTWMTMIDCTYRCKQVSQPCAMNPAPPVNRRVTRKRTRLLLKPPMLSAAKHQLCLRQMLVNLQSRLQLTRQTLLPQKLRTH